MRWSNVLAAVAFGSLLVLASPALAQETGGSFGGGDFSSGSAGSSGSSSSSAGSDSGDGLSLVLYLVIEIIASPWIPWPLKIVLAVGVVGVGVVVAIVRRRRRRRDD